MARLDRKPVAFEWWLFKWVFGSMAVLGVAWAVGAGHYARHQCGKTCNEKGFSGFVYFAPAMRGTAGRCQCGSPHKD